MACATGGAAAPDPGANVDPEREAAVAAIAAGQDGLVTRAQLLDAGVSGATIRRRAASGLLVPVGARTYRLPSAPPTDRQAVRAACLDHDAVPSHRTSTWLHGYMPLGGVIEVTVLKGRSTTLAAADRRTLVVHASTNLPPEDIVEVDGIRTMSLARTLMSLGALVPHVLTEEQLIDVVSAALETGAASLPWLRWVLAERRCRGRDGVAAFERALDARTKMGPTESWLERRLLRLVDAAGLPRPALQRRIARSAGGPARVDFLYEAERLVIEALGYAFHRTPDQLTADTMRANELQVAGYQVLQVTSRAMDQEPQRICRLIGEAVAGRGTLLSRQALTDERSARQNGADLWPGGSVAPGAHR